MFTAILTGFMGGLGGDGKVGRKSSLRDTLPHRARLAEAMRWMRNLVPLTPPTPWPPYVGSTARSPAFGVRCGGKVKKAGSAKKQRARKRHTEPKKGGKHEVVEMTSGDFVCSAGPGAVDMDGIPLQGGASQLRKVGRLVMTHTDHIRLKLAGIGAERGCASSDSDDGNNSDDGDDGRAALIRLFAAHAADDGACA